MIYVKQEGFNFTAHLTGNNTYTLSMAQRIWVPNAFYSIGWFSSMNWKDERKCAMEPQTAAAGIMLCYAVCPWGALFLPCFDNIILFLATFRLCEVQEQQTPPFLNQPNVYFHPVVYSHQLPPFFCSWKNVWSSVLGWPSPHQCPSVEVRLHSR